MTSQSTPSFFINLSSSDIDEAETFFAALGFTPMTAWNLAQSKCLLLPRPNEQISLMIHSPGRFRDFMRPGTDIVDAHRSTEALFSITVGTREEVDAWLARVVAAGGTLDPYELPGYGEDMGMYSRSFADLDGHIWEVLAALPGAEVPDCAQGRRGLGEGSGLDVV